MKTLVVYYSYTGKTATVAKAVAAETGAEIRPVEDLKRPSMLAAYFSGCFKARTDASWGAWHAASTAWMHPLVPISSLVKSEGIDRPSSMDLVGFGETGATSEIP